MAEGLWVLLGVFTLAAVLGAPLGLAMLTAGFVYLIATHQDTGLVVDQTMNGLYNSYLLIAVPMFIFVANVMNASGVIERLLAFGGAMVGHLPGGLAQVNVVTNLIFSGMSGSAVADASGPGLVLARMMAKEGRYPPGFAAATSVVSATLGPLMPTSIPMIFYALIANASVGAMFLGGSGAGGPHGAVDDGGHCPDRAPARLSARKAHDLDADCAGARSRAVADRAARHFAGAYLFGHHHADRGGRDRCRLCAIARVDRLPHAQPAAPLRRHVRHGPRHRHDRADHVRGFRVQLCGGE